uniref:Beta-chimaerin n=1 Tax=Ciona savignyi TaxID=51511 RepID=H2YZ17_CIOSA
SRPHFYGPECHGLVSRIEGGALCREDGDYLIRESQNDRGRFTLVMRYIVLGVVKNFKLYYEDGKHFVGEKRFDSVYDLVEDGLITMFVESKAQDYIERMVHEPVYNSLTGYAPGFRYPANPAHEPAKSVTSPVMSPSPRHRNVTSPSKKSPSKLPTRPKCLLAQQYEKEHHYKSHTYRGLQWCEYCGNFMWGIIQQGVQCIDCGLNVHKQCSKLVPNDCQPALKHVQHVFGVDLTTLVKLHGTQRPIVVDMCISEIEKRGMDSEGIYRVSGSHDEIIELKAAFDQRKFHQLICTSKFDRIIFSLILPFLVGSEVNLTAYEDVNTIAGALKLYLRELPVPILPYRLYSRFINAAKISHEDGKLDAVRMALSATPGAHFETIKYLIQHLGRVSDISGENQMTSHNLGIVFGPTLLRTPEKDANQRYNYNDTQFQQGVIESMIEYRHHLF